AYGLADGETLSDGHLYTLTGVITSVNDAYSSQYGNVTVTIQIGDMTDKLIKCYRMKGNGADVIKTGDTITVTGVLKNYKGTIEFDAGCTLDSYVPGEEEVVIYKTPEEIVNALYELEAGETLSDGYVYELTGVIVEVNEPYNEAYGNIGVTIQIGDMADKLIYCYRLKGEGADLIDVGDTITVKGSLKNYNGTREFVSCSILSYELKPEFARGDVDGNGKVNALDYAKLKAHCMRLRTLSEEELSRSDLNGDNRVNVLDYGVLKKLVMNKKSS
ncbi:MAG: dockerin type I repeat-containing protein, partial [Clostridia bacterium]|nr:dockerin type I repeat-containing protein [Clostridia bacterium]